MNIGGIIRTARKKAGATQRIFAGRLGLSQGELSRIETGKRNYRSIRSRRTLQRIAHHITGASPLRIEIVPTGAAIRGMRLAKKFTQSQVARRVQVSTAFVSAIERDKKRISPDLWQSKWAPVFEIRCSCGATDRLFRNRETSEFTCISCRVRDLYYRNHTTVPNNFVDTSKGKGEDKEEK